MEAPRRGGCCSQQERAAEPGFLPSDLRLSEQHFPDGFHDHLHQGHLGSLFNSRSQYPLDHPNHRYMRAGSIDKISRDFGPTL